MTQPDLLTHPTPDALVDRPTEPGVAAHLDRCPACRVEARILAAIRQTDPDALPRIDEARQRLAEAQRQASATLSRSLESASDRDLDDLPPGHVVDERYTVEHVVGSGGMGTVYRVRHNELGSLHALKVLHVASPAIRERLIREGRAQSGLRHPNVVPVTDVVRVGGSPGLILEYVDGPTLSRWLRTHGRPSLPVADAIATGVLRGVAAAHRAGLVHRDLKPGNVLLAPGDDGPVPRVTDFGLVRELAPGGAGGLTVSDTPMGTPAYMAPEQLRDASTADQRSDVFSLGALLYELVTGQRAFDGRDWLDVCDRIRAGWYEAPDAAVPELPDRIVRTLERCLEVDPADRFPDCASVLEAWSGVGATRPAASAGRALDAPLAALPGWLRRPAPWLGLALAAALALAVVGGAVWLATGPGGWLASDPVEPLTAGAPVISDDPAAQARLDTAWNNFLLGDLDAATRQLERFPPEAAWPQLLRAASLDFDGHRGRARVVLDEASAHLGDRSGRAATLLRLYRDALYPQAPLDGWRDYLQAHPDDYLAHLLAARLAGAEPALLEQWSDRALALQPAGVRAVEAVRGYHEIRRARRATSLDDRPRTGSWYPGQMLIGADSRLWSLDPAERWQSSIPMFEDIVAAHPAAAQERHLLASMYGLDGQEARRQEHLEVLFSPTTDRLDRLQYAPATAWFDFGRGRYGAARDRLRACEADATSSPSGRATAWSGPLFPEAIRCADGRAEMALRLGDVAEARDAIDALSGWVARPGVPTGLSRRMGAAVVALEARIALGDGWSDRAEALREQLVEQRPAYIGGATGDAALFDLVWRLDDDPRTALAYHEARRDRGCRWALGYGRAALAVGDADAAIPVLEQVADGTTCPPGPFTHGYFRAEARILLAEALARRGDVEGAAARVAAFRKAWPLADPDHPLVRRAEALEPAP